MISPRLRRYPLWAAALLIALGCGDRGAWVPVLEQTSTSFLQNQTEKALERVQEARATLLSSPEAAEASLDEAATALLKLNDYYFPLLKAREQAYNAYRHYYLGETAAVEELLDRIAEELEEVGRKGDEPIARELKGPLETIADARLAIETNSGSAPKELERLAIQLNFLELRGELIFAGRE